MNNNMPVCGSRSNNNECQPCLSMPDCESMGMLTGVFKMECGNRVGAVKANTYMCKKPQNTGGVCAHDGAVYNRRLYLY